MKWCERWFGVLLRLMPTRFRARHGNAMRETFSGACAEHRARGRVAVVAFVLRTTVDLVASGVRERLRPRRRARPGAGREGSGGRGWLSPWLDIKLGVRLMAKHPRLTLVSTFALAV
jgi:hypothetical protein